MQETEFAEQFLQFKSEQGTHFPCWGPWAFSQYVHKEKLVEQLLQDINNNDKTINFNDKAIQNINSDRLNKLLRELNFKEIEDSDQFKYYYDYINNNYNFQALHKGELIDGGDWEPTFVTQPEDKNVWINLV